MSKVVDERVVEMRFDNKQFESNVSQSMSTLEKLKRSLNLSGASKGLDELNTSAKKIDMSGLGRGVEAVSAKFSALQVIGVTALANITNSAVNAGKRMVSALTIDPIKTGFQEYETKINAVQTILSNTASKGTTMSDVTKTLDELNLYADKTIYNFAEMTRNIGTFTAAGVGLKESASAIQGIANLAAASGSSSQQASTAMYQLSQALAAGTVKLQDWNSVVNAGMGGQKFQDALKATAKEHGVAVDEIIKKNGSFRESLQEGWISADILNETLSKFTVDGAQKYAKSMMESGKWTQEQADALIKEAKSMEDAATKVKTFTQLWDTLKESAQSGWSQSWEIIIGDFEKAKGRLTEISDLMGNVIGESANRRNDLLEGSLTSKWDILVKNLNSAGIETENFQNKILELSGTHKEEFQKMIDESDTFEEAVKKALSAGIIDKAGIKEAFKGVTGEISKLSEEELKNKGYTENQIKALRDLAGQADGTGGSIDDLISKIDRASGAELIWDSLLNVLKSIIAPMGAIRKAWDEVFPLNPEGIYNTIKAIKEFTDRILEAATASDTLNNITRIFKGIFSVVDIVWTGIKSLIGGIRDLLKNFTGMDLGILDLAASFGDFLSNLRNGIKESNVFGKTIDKIVGFLTGCINKVKEFGSAIKESIDIPEFDNVLTFFKSMGSLIASIGTGAGKTLSTLGSGLAKIFGKIDVSRMLDMLNEGLFAGVLISLRNYIKGLTDPFDKATSIFDSIKGTFENIKGTLDDVRSSLEAYQNNLKANVLLKIASAIGVLAVSLAIISSIDSDKLDSSLGAVAGLFGELVAAMAIMNKINSKGDVVKPLTGLVNSLSNISKTIQMIGLSASILILAGAMRMIADLDWDGVAKGLVGVAGMIGMLVAVSRLMETDSKSITKFAGQMILLSVAIGALSYIAKYLSMMSWEELGKAGAGLLGIVTMLVATAKIMNTDSKAITKFAGQMILLSASIGALSYIAKYLSMMSWEELGKAGAGIFGIVTMLIATAKIMDSESATITKFSGQMLLISAAIGILAVVGTKISSMSWEELGKAGAGILGLVTMLVAAAKIMDTGGGSITKFAGQMLLMSASLAILVSVMKSLGSMSWESIGKGLTVIGVALAELAIGLNCMNGTLGGSAALLIAATALAIITPVLKTLGSMSLESIFKALTTLAGAFLTIGIAGMALSPLIPVILGLAAAFALFGIATLGIGAGLTLIGVGLTSIAAAGTAAAASLVASIGIIINGFLGLIPAIIGKLGEAIVAFCQLIGQVAPQIAEAVLQLVTSVLQSLGKYGPQIVDSLLTFLIDIINGLTAHMPELIQAAMNLIGSLVKGIIDSLNGLDTGSLLKGVIAVGLMTGLMYALSGIVALIPSAMAGLLGVGAVVAELALVLAAIGGLAQIPGLEWLISESGDFLQKIGTAIGQFVGGIAGGVAEGFTSSLPEIGTNLSTFITNLEPFISGVKNIDPSMLDGIQTLVKCVLLLTGADLISKLASFVTGDNSLSDFGKQLVPFGKSLNEYGKAVSGINTEAITRSAEAAEAMVKVANAVPSEGGFWSLITGKKDLSSFGKKLIPFGESMKEYAESVAGIDISSIVMSATAAKALINVANAIPADGGFWSLINGEKNLGSFGEKLIPFGEGMKKYAEAISGINTPSIIMSAIAAKSLVDVANAIPVEGGFWSLIEGEKDLGSFGAKLIPFGLGMKAYATVVSGIDIPSIIMSATAAKALISVANAIPAEGGFWSLVEGQKDLGSFGMKLVSFGLGMKAYATAVAGIDIASILTSVSAAHVLISVANAIPVEGGFWSLIDGEKDLGSFGTKLIPFGQGMKSYAEAVAGIDVASILSSVPAAHALVSVANAIPAEGGFWALIDGEKNLASFGLKLIPFGIGMKAYAEAVSGVDTTSIIASTNAAQAIVSVANAIPVEGGFWSLIEGEKDLGSFGSKLVPFGIGMKTYAESVSGIDTASIYASVPAAHALISVANAIPVEGRFWSLIEGEKDLASFSRKLIPFGIGMKSYAEAVVGIDTTSIIASCVAAQAIVRVANAIPVEGGFWSLIEGGKDLGSFGKKLVPFGEGMKSYAEAVAGVDTSSIIASANAAKALIKVADMIPEDGGIWEIITGGKDLGSFGKKLVPFGKGMKSYAESVAGLDVGSIISSVPGAKAVVRVAQSIPEDLAISISASSMTSIGTKLVSFANTMKNYASAVAGVNSIAISSSVSAAKSMVSLVKSMNGVSTSGVSSFVTAINTLGKAQVSKFVQAFASASPKMVSAGKNIMSSLANGIKSGQAIVMNVTNSMVSKMNNSIRSKSDTFRTSGTAVMSKFISGISSQKGKVSSAVRNTVSGAANALKSYYNSFYAAGKYVAQGFANGISTGTYAAAARARAMANAAKAAAQKALNEHSPSKVFYQIGAYAGQGFINAFGDYTSKAFNASYEMAEKAKSGLSKAISRVSDILNSDMDAQPTIRPVIDLTNVKSGAAAINGMFNRGVTIGASDNLRAVSYAMANRNQNGLNDDVVSAINNLGKQLGNLNGTTNIINGVTYDDGSNVANAVADIIQAARIERRR